MEKKTIRSVQNNMKGNINYGISHQKTLIMMLKFITKAYFKEDRRIPSIDFGGQLASQS